VRNDPYIVEVEGQSGWKAGPVALPAPGQRSDLVVPMQRR